MQLFTLYFFQIKFRLVATKKCFESFLERSKNREQCVFPCIYHDYEKTRSKFKVQSVILEKINRGTEWHQHSYSSSKIVRGDMKIGGQDVTF